MASPPSSRSCSSASRNRSRNAPSRASRRTGVELSAYYLPSNHLIVDADVAPAITASLTLLNILDEKANDITYYYESQLRNEAQPVNDIHFHPVEPREFRVTLAARF